MKAVSATRRGAEPLEVFKPTQDISTAVFRDLPGGSGDA